MGGLTEDSIVNVLNYLQQKKNTWSILYIFANSSLYTDLVLHEGLVLYGSNNKTAATH